MCGGKEKQPEVSWSQSPEYAKQQELFTKYQEPYMASQYNLYQDVFEPQARSLGQKLGNQLNQPLSLPDDIWNSLWQKGRENVGAEYGNIRQSASERAAGSGMLGQGPTEKYFQNLDLSQAKSMESLAADMAIQEWMEKKTSQQQAIQNSMGYQGMQPSFNLQMPTSQQVVSQDEGYGGLLGGLGGVGGALLGAWMGGPAGAAVGYSAGSSLGQGIGG
jgi:hypothetical protein